MTWTAYGRKVSLVPAPDWPRKQTSFDSPMKAQIAVDLVTGAAAGRHFAVVGDLP
jgi:hypothetical protein